LRSKKGDKKEAILILWKSSFPWFWFQVFGALRSFSCLNHTDETLFEKIVLGAVRDAGKTAQILGKLGPGPDHPTDLTHPPEGRYLKGLLLAISTS
jgi:hypothetical protein